ncbi:MAG: T9SS type A sorting domain-containing protein, partial [Candidatus Delongbacteria bacterium]|nr:T9SS type A sorting domain-containing protein [Candidatus Delongbacteria bacterium]
NEISNNIIWSNNGVAQISRYDAYYVKFSFNAIQDGYEGFGNYSLSSNNEGDFNSPYFTDPDNNDWSLQSLSPCIDTGVFWNALDVDINLNPRPQGVSYDMGAYEYESLEPNAVLPTLSTLPAENISSTYATLRGNITDDGGTQLVAKGIKYSNISGFDPNTEGTLIRLMELLNEGEFELLVTNLSPDTTYYYRAYCENKIGYSYANEELSFTTTDSIIINPDINGIVYLKEDGIGDGSSWANALSGYKLQNGIDHVNTKEIWVAKGKYIPMNWPCERIEYKLDENDFIYKFQEYGKSERKYYGTTEREKHFTLRPSKKLYGGFAGTETSIDQRDIKNNETILSGDIGVKGYAQDNTYHVVYIGNELASDSNSVIDGFTIQDGYADGTIRDYSYFGGGMFNRCTPPTIQDCVFKNNYAIRGGGMFNVFGGLCGDISASPLIYNTIITQNVAELSGGGIFGFSASPTLINCLITQNTAGEEGGGICHKVYSFYDRVVAILKMQSCTIADNNAPIGNGLYIYHDLEDIEDKEIIQNSVIFGNIPALTFNFEDQVGPIQTISYCGITGGYFGEGNINLSPNNTGDEYSPYFSDPDNGHWWIQEHSPLRNAGIWTDDVPLYDIAGNLRDAVPDIGCYEYDPTGIEDNESSLPLTIKLYQNYPNPFNPVTNIKFDLSKTGKVELSVYNIAGQLVKKIVDKEISAGYHSVRFEANDLNSGMYFYTLRTSDKKLTRKMLMIK